MSSYNSFHENSFLIFGRKSESVNVPIENFISFHFSYFDGLIRLADPRILDLNPNPREISEKVPTLDVIEAVAKADVWKKT